MKFGWPDSIAGRALLVLLVGLMVSHVASTAMYFTESNEALRLLGDQRIAERMAVITRLVEETPPTDRQRILDVVDAPNVHVMWSQSDPTTADTPTDGRSYMMEHFLRGYLGDAESGEIRMGYGGMMADRRPDGAPSGDQSGPAGQFQMMPHGRHMAVHHAMSGRHVQASVELSDSTWLTFVAPLEVPRPFSSVRFILSMSIMLVAVVILSVWVVRRLTARLATFAHAAERLGVDVNAPRLPESGPREVRQAARAFNEMQRRIRRFVEDRTQMVAAIAHDLGTPITRLRLRAEYVGDEEQRRKVLADLDEMERMIASTLSFVRDETATEPRQTFDLVSLLQSVCDDLSDAGHTIGFHSEGRLPYECRPIALRRALTNVIENAVKFGNQAWVSLDARDDTVLITIDDDGPGIPDQYHADVFKPFQRLEDSRSRETGGTGLGLTVARTIVRAHGGDITLSNRSEGGLHVAVALPR
jgi:signal transduction histidine kinase